MIDRHEQALLTLSALHPISMKIDYSEICAQTDPNRHQNHSHDQCEVYINVSGNVSFVVEEQLYPIKSGSVIITRRHEMHHCIYNDAAPHKHYWILFTPDENEHLFPLFFDRETGKNNLIVLSGEQQQTLFTVCRNLLTADSGSLNAYYYFFKLMKILAGGSAQNASDQIASRCTMDALKYIRKHQDSPISISQMATELHVSINTLERNFKKDMGLSPLKYILECKLLMASSLLSNGHTVSDTAERCGFTDYSHFISDFKRRFGKTPLQYQKT